MQESPDQALFSVSYCPFFSPRDAALRFLLAPLPPGPGLAPGSCKLALCEMPRGSPFSMFMLLPSGSPVSTCPCPHLYPPPELMSGTLFPPLFQGLPLSLSPDSGPTISLSLEMNRNEWVLCLTPSFLGCSLQPLGLQLLDVPTSAVRVLPEHCSLLPNMNCFFWLTELWLTPVLHRSPFHMIDNLRTPLLGKELCSHP